MKRRTVVTALGAGLVSASGCSGLGNRDYADVRFYNNTSEALTLTLRAVADGEEVVAETLSVPYRDTSQPEREYEEFPGTRALTVHVAVEDGPRGTHEFEDSKTDSKTLNVDLYPESVKFLVSGA